MIAQITVQAEADLESISDYIARDNPVRVLSVVQELCAKCLDLAEMPLEFPLVPRYESQGIRRRTLFSTAPRQTVLSSITFCTVRWITQRSCSRNDIGGAASQMNDLLRDHR